MSRRNSKAYEQPILDSIGPDGIPSVRVEDSSLPEWRLGRIGTMIDFSSSPLGSTVAKCGVALLLMAAAIFRVLGEKYLGTVSQLFGFTLIFTFAFLLCCGLFAWWGSWGKEAVGLTSRKVLIIYGICTASEIVSLMLNQYIDLGTLELLPVNVSLYAILGLSLLFLFAIFVHGSGVAAMFSNESSAFVGLVLLLHFSMASLFHNTLPPLIYGQLVHTSCFLGLALLLMLKQVKPDFRLSRLRQMVSGSQPKQALKVPHRTGRKVSNFVDLPDSYRHTNSVSSQSSMTSSIPASVSVLGGGGGGRGRNELSPSMLECG